MKSYEIKIGDVYSFFNENTEKIGKVIAVFSDGSVYLETLYPNNINEEYHEVQSIKAHPIAMNKNSLLRLGFNEKNGCLTKKCKNSEYTVITENNLNILHIINNDTNVNETIPSFLFGCDATVSSLQRHMLERYGIELF